MKHIAVLMGGWSPEREVSLVSGQAVAHALTEMGYAVTAIDVSKDLGHLFNALTHTKHPRPVDVIFNALHGVGGEDGVIQGALEVLGVPYTHSGVMASALAMHKPAARILFQAAGLRIADGRVISVEDLRGADPLPCPYVVKPLNQGSSVGVTIVHTSADRTAALQGLSNEDTEILVETYIPGREIQVAIMGDRAIGAIEIRPKSGFYDYAAKYTPGLADHLMPAPIAPDDYAMALDWALRAHQALECRGVSRVDLRFNDTADGPARGFYVLEVNTQPGMTPLSLVPEIAAHHGISFNQLVQWMIDTATCDAYAKKAA